MPHLPFDPSPLDHPPYSWEHGNRSSLFLAQRTMIHSVTHRRVERLHLRRWLILGLLVLLAGCSLTPTAYRYADWLILWQLDHYFDLNRVQARDLAQQLKPLLARHRQEAIPQYEAFLRQFQQRFERGLASEDIDWVYATYDALRIDLYDRLVADGGVFLASVDQQQVTNLEETLQKDNRKAARLVEAPKEERLKKRAQATIDSLEDWLGSLSKEQQAQIREWSIALPDQHQVRLAYQQERQQELLTLLHHPRTSDRAAVELRHILLHPNQTMPQAYQDAFRQMRDAVKTMTLAIDHRLTPAQRRHALTKLQKLIDQVHSLRVE